MTNAITKNNYIPKDYEDLYRYYIVGDGGGNSLTHKVLRKMLPYSTPEEREDLASDVLLRCMQKQVIETGGSSRSARAVALGKPGVFDPTKANFGGVIFFVIRTVVGNYLGQKSRNPVTGLKAGTLTDMEPAGDGGFEPGVFHLDRLFPAENPDPGSLMDLRKRLQELHDRCAALAAKAHPTSYQDTRNRSLLPLLGLLLQECDPDECGKKLGVTASTIHNWLGVLREMAEDIKNTVLAEKKRPLGPGKMLPVEE